MEINMLLHVIQQKGISLTIPKDPINELTDIHSEK